MTSRSVAWRRILFPATLLLLAVAVAGPVWGAGFLNTRGGGDSPFLLQRTHQLVANLRAGVFPARWMPDAAYGLGYPFFSYYAALPYYLAAGLTLIGLDILVAIKLTQTIFFIAAALTMYAWARRALDDAVGGWLAATAYTLAPYHMVNVYVRGDSLSEFAAFAFYPLILWGLDRLAERPSLQRTILPGLAYAGLILTHNISALIFSPILLAYALVRLLRSIRGRPSPVEVALFVAPVVIGLLLAAWFWIPALAEARFVQLTAQTSGYFAYDNHFRSNDLIQPSIIFDYTTITENQTPFAMGLLQAILALLGGGFVFLDWLANARQRGWTNAPARILALIGLVVSTFLITPLSRPLWDHLLLLPMVQFPWRFLSIQALFAALLIGFLPRLFVGRKVLVAIILVSALVLAGLVGLQPEYLPIAAEAVTAEHLQLYELFTGNVGTTIRYEYLPRAVVPRPWTGPSLFSPDASPQPIAEQGRLLNAELIHRRPAYQVWHVEVGPAGASVAFPLIYWPGWRATVDGQSVPADAAPSSGFITADLPGGAHTVTLRLGRTPTRAIAEGISLGSLIAVIALSLLLARRPAEPSDDANGRAWPVVGGLGLIALALLATLAPRVQTGANDLTMDFDQRPYLHPNPEGIPIAEGRILSYRYAAERLAPGETLEVALALDVEKEGMLELRLVSPAVTRRQRLAPIAAGSVALEPGTAEARIELALPERVGPGTYLIQMEERGTTTYLRPIQVEGQAASGSSQASFADERIALLAAATAQIDPQRLAVQLTWSARQRSVENYGIAFRLTDAAGHEWMREDTQPGYGFHPTSLWLTNRAIHDRYTLVLPPGIPPGQAYTLNVILYRVESGASVGQTTLPVSLTEATRRPDAPVLARLAESLALSGLEAPETIGQGQTLDLTAYWLALDRPEGAYSVEWQLTRGETVISQTLPLVPGLPATTWPRDAWVAGRAAMAIPATAPPGAYELSLALVGPDGDPLGSYVTDRPITIEARERVWQPPPMERTINAQFGDSLKLLGYDLQQEEKGVILTFHWQALRASARDYMFFVHVADPLTGEPLAQVDAMPRAFTYPTGEWASGEIVSDEVAVSLEEVAPGSYELAVGWYDPETKDRLPVTNPAGLAHPEHRLILPDQVQVTH